MKKFKVSDLKIVTFTFKYEDGHIQMFYKPIKGGKSAGNSESHIEVYYTDKNGEILLWKGVRYSYINKTNAITLLNQISAKGVLGYIKKVEL